MEIINVAVLIFTFFIGETKNLKTCSYGLMAQSLIILIGVLWIGYFYNIPSLYFIALLDLAVRALLMPYVILKSVQGENEREVKPTISHPLSIALSIVILSVVYRFVEVVRNFSLTEALPPFSCGATLLIYGLFLFVSKSDYKKLMLSFFIIENGIHFLIISLIPKMPKIIEISLTLNFVLALLFFLYIIGKLNISQLQTERAEYSKKGVERP